MGTAFTVLRWVHVLAGAAWFGEVVVITLVLVPLVSKSAHESQIAFLARVFPSIFRLASWLAAASVLAGIVVLVLKLHGHWAALWSTEGGVVTLIGAGLGIALALFHFIAEPRLDGMICAAEESGDIALTGKIMRTLRSVPRVGLGVTTMTVVAMMIGARGV